MKFEKSEIELLFASQYPDLKALELSYYEGGSNLIFYAHLPGIPETISYVFKIIPNFKRYNFEIADFDFMYSYKQYLAGQSTIISEILPTKENKLFDKIRMNGIDWIYSLHQYIHGNIQFPITNKTAYSAGQRLAILHEQSLYFKHHYKRNYYSKSNLLIASLQVINDHRNLFDNFEDLITRGKYLLTIFDKIDIKPLKYIIHGDFWHGNIIVDKEPAFIDFDFVSYGRPEMDLASMKLLGLQHAILDVDLIQAVNRMVKSTIEGYNSVGKHQLDTHLIDDLARMRGYWTIAAYLNSFGYLSSEHIEKRIAKTIQVLDYLH